MKLKILYDNESPDSDAASGLGFSCLIDQRVLFDTGPGGRELKHNVERFHVDLDCLEAIVISHDHWDHVGGLEYVTGLKRNLKVYLCPGFSPDFKTTMSTLPARSIDVPHFMSIAPRMYSTGEITGIYKGNAIAEQSMILHGDQGFSVLTGCAHPGIITILKKVKSQISAPNFHVVLGGFHLKNNSLEEIQRIVSEFSALKVKMAVPLHCTGSEAVRVFQREYGDRVRLLKAGDEIDV